MYVLFIYFPGRINGVSPICHMFHRAGLNVLSVLQFCMLNETNVLKFKTPQLFEVPTGLAKKSCSSRDPTINETDALEPFLFKSVSGLKTTSGERCHCDIAQQRMEENLACMALKFGEISQMCAHYKVSLLDTCGCFDTSIQDAAFHHYKLSSCVTALQRCLDFPDRCDHLRSQTHLQRRAYETKYSCVQLPNWG